MLALNVAGDCRITRLAEPTEAEVWLAEEQALRMRKITRDCHAAPPHDLEAAFVTQKTNPHRVFVVDDHATIRETLKGLIDSESDLVVCGVASCRAEALERIPQAQPDVVILDLSLPDGSGAQVLRVIHHSNLKTHIIVFSSYDSFVYAKLMRSEGARGYVDKHDTPRAIIEAIRAVVAGGTYF